MSIVSFATSASVKDKNSSLPFPVVIRLEDNRFYQLKECYCSNLECECYTAIIEASECTPYGEVKKEEQVTALFEYEWCEDCETLGWCEHYTLSFREEVAQTKLGRMIMDAFRQKIEIDPVYCQSLYDNYRRVKFDFAKKDVVGQEELRDALCPCGSGKAYKKCCLLVF